jgi:hypothetical protein
VPLSRKRLTRRQRCCKNHTFSYKKKRRNRTPHGHGGLRGPSGIANEKTTGYDSSRHSDHDLFCLFWDPPFTTIRIAHPQYDTTTPYSPAHNWSLLSPSTCSFYLRHTPALCALVFVLHLPLCHIRVLLLPCCIFLFVIPIGFELPGPLIVYQVSDLYQQSRQCHITVTHSLRRLVLLHDYSNRSKLSVDSDTPYDHSTPTICGVPAHDVHPPEQDDASHTPGSRSYETATDDECMFCNRRVWRV